MRINQVKQKLMTKCRMHGGASTGPKTPEGKIRSFLALAKGRELRRLRMIGVLPALPAKS